MRQTGILPKAIAPHKKGMVMAMRFNYYLPVNLVFGRGVITQLGEMTARYGTRALVVTGKTSTKKTGLLDKALGLLQDAGVTPVVFDRVEPNPLTTTAESGAAFAAEHGCDVVVGLGGGSIMDAAKAIAFCTENHGDISDYIFGRLQSEKAMPVIAVPTTSGTGSEGNGFAVLTNPETKDKKSLRTPVIVPKVSLVDPELMMTMPKTLTATVGFDALCHNIEAYLSSAGQPLTDMMALHGISLLSKSLQEVYDDPSNLEAWEDVTFASTLGGMVINTAGISAAHSMEHPISGLYDAVHGLGLAALLPTVVDQSWQSAPAKFQVISQLLGGSGAEDCAEAIRSLLYDLDIATTLSQLGAKEKDLDWLADNCIHVGVAGINNNPRRFSRDEIKELYRMCL